MQTVKPNQRKRQQIEHDSAGGFLSFRIVLHAAHNHISNYKYTICIIT